MRGENKREGRERRGWGSIRGRVGEERIKREGEVVETGEMESSLIFRTIFLLFAYTLVFAFSQLHNASCFCTIMVHREQTASIYYCVKEFS